MSFFPKKNASRIGLTQTIAFDDSQDAEKAFGPETYQVRLIADRGCCFRIGDGRQTATTADVYLAANTAEYFIVSPGQHIAAIKVSAPGTLWITEMS